MKSKQIYKTHNRTKQEYKRRTCWVSERSLLRPLPWLILGTEAVPEGAVLGTTVFLFPALTMGLAHTCIKGMLYGTAGAGLWFKSKSNELDREFSTVERDQLIKNIKQRKS